ncbi:uncharacterized protein LOC114142167 isoform X1 [Xiphophorus couchianus]|uniref:uncharacterized protein LOC114142167 isoform X1 n=1 Tax=Xiphophorus couchianus TaxID=32473 RepID=UPI001016226E|nr:uncharacterized protein LOC114142167 isoform X1 [Xiphophorus couchianus]
MQFFIITSRGTPAELVQCSHKGVRALQHLCIAAMATAESVFPDQSDFHYDYETLRTTGVILAVVMFVSGILIALTPARLVPKYQKQKFLLQLYRKCSTCLQRKSAVTGPLLTNALFSYNVFLAKI